MAKQCKDSYFLCCLFKYIKCKCGCSLIDTDGQTFKFKVCLTTAVQCPHCDVFNFSEGSSRIECTSCHFDYNSVTVQYNFIVLVFISETTSYYLFILFN